MGRFFTVNKEEINKVIDQKRKAAIQKKMQRFEQKAQRDYFKMTEKIEKQSIKAGRSFAEARTMRNDLQNKYLKNDTSVSTIK